MKVRKMVRNGLIVSLLLVFCISLSGIQIGKELERKVSNKEDAFKAITGLAENFDIKIANTNKYVAWSQNGYLVTFRCIDKNSKTYNHGGCFIENKKTNNPIFFDGDSWFDRRPVKGKISIQFLKRETEKAVKIISSSYYESHNEYEIMYKGSGCIYNFRSKKKSCTSWDKSKGYFLIVDSNDTIRAFSSIEF